MIKQFLSFLIFIFPTCFTVNAAKIPFIVDQNIKASNAIDKYADDLDTYLSDGVKKAEKNETQIIIKNQANWNETTDEVEYSTDLDVKIHLPKLEKKWELRFTSYETDEEETGINKNRIQSRPREERYGAALIFADKLADFDVRFQPQIRIDQGIRQSILLEFESSADYKDLSVSHGIDFFARYDEGTGMQYSISLLHKLSENNTLGFINDLAYVDHRTLMSSNHSLYGSHVFNRKFDARLGTIFESNDEPHFRLQKYTYYLSFGYRMYKNVLHFNLTPRLEHPRNKSFRQVEAAQLNMDIIF